MTECKSQDLIYTVACCADLYNEIHCSYNIIDQHTHIASQQVVSENGTHIDVTFQISNLTSLANIDPSTNVTAYSAVEMLSSNSLSSRLLPFKIRISPNMSVTPQVFVLGRGANATQRQCDECSSSPLSTGAIAGIAIALFVFGLVLGLLLQLCLGLVLAWCRKNSGSMRIGQAVKYEKHDDDLNIT